MKKFTFYLTAWFLFLGIYFIALAILKTVFGIPIGVSPLALIALTIASLQTAYILDKEY